MDECKAYGEIISMGSKEGVLNLDLTTLQNRVIAQLRWAAKPRFSTPKNSAIK
jgi:hypothetical protein